MAKSKYACFCQCVKKNKGIRPISKGNHVISYRLSSACGDFSTEGKLKSQTKIVPLIKAEVQLVTPDVVSFYSSLAIDSTRSKRSP